jgi:hypothetical protein
MLFPDYMERAFHQFWFLSFLSQYFLLPIQNIDILPMHGKFHRKISKMQWADFGNYIAFSVGACFKKSSTTPIY